MNKELDLCYQDEEISVERNGRPSQLELQLPDSVLNGAMQLLFNPTHQQTQVKKRKWKSFM